MTIDEATFRQAMGSFASGVTVVTTSVAGRLFGITVSAFCSLSLDPQLVLVCIERNVPSHAALAQSGVFGLSLLRETQADLSQRFATRMPDKFAGVAYRLGQTGAPLLDGAIATVECRVVEQLPGGDHTIFVGQVLAAETHPGQPLLYFRSDYHRLADEPA